MNTETAVPPLGLNRLLCRRAHTVVRAGILASQLCRLFSGRDSPESTGGVSRAAWALTARSCQRSRRRLMCLYVVSMRKQ